MKFIYLLIYQEEIIVFSDFFEAIQGAVKIINKNGKIVEEFGIYKKYMKIEKNGAWIEFKEYFFEIQRKKINKGEENES